MDEVDLDVFRLLLVEAHCGRQIILEQSELVLDHRRIFERTRICASTVALKPSVVAFRRMKSRVLDLCSEYTEVDAICHASVCG